MKPKFVRSGPALTPENVTAAERRLGIPIPESLAAHYLQHNGGSPEPDYYVKPGDEPYWINALLPISEQSESDLVDRYIRMTGKGVLPGDLIPFAVDPGGNFFCIDPVGAVYFFATDSWSEKRTTQENQEHAKEYIIGNFDDFLAGFVDEDTAYDA